MQGSGESDERQAVNLAGVFAQSDNKSLLLNHTFLIFLLNPFDLDFFCVSFFRVKPHQSCRKVA